MEADDAATELPYDAKLDRPLLLVSIDESIGRIEAGEEPPEVDSGDDDEGDASAGAGGAGRKAPFTLHDDTLDDIMAAVHETGCSKISVVSVAGPFRTGKSFLLDCFLRYLRFNDARVGRQGAGAGESGWLTSGGRLAIDGRVGSETSERGFSWRGGSDRQTTGIWVYGRPFVLTVRGGEKVAVLLMDTQGLFDSAVNADTTASIFALSTLLSSHQIYNVDKVVDEKKVETLHFFTEFARVAAQEFRLAQQRDGAAAAADGAGGRAVPRPFQALELLVRDWQHFTDEEDVDLCYQEMEQEHQRVLSSSFQEGVEARQALTAAFDALKFFLLPHPGKKLTMKSFDGSVDGLDPAFLRLLEAYVDRVFSDDLAVKSVAGRALDSHTLPAYIRAFVTVFKTGKLPKSTTIVDAISQTTNLLARDSAIAAYKRAMSECTDSSKPLTTKELEQHHVASSTAAVELFNTSPILGSSTKIDATREELKTMLDEALELFRRRNDSKLKSALAQYAIVLLIFVSGFLVDRISDYACDWWLPLCQDLSQTLLMVYGVCFMVLAFVSVSLYRTHGSQVLTDSWVDMALRSQRVARQLYARAHGALTGSSGGGGGGGGSTADSRGGSSGESGSVSSLVSGVVGATAGTLKRRARKASDADAKGEDGVAEGAVDHKKSE